MSYPISAATPTLRGSFPVPPSHTGLMSKRPKVPEALHGYPTLYKLIWLYVEPEEGEIRVEEMAQDLDVSFAKATTALRHMADTGAVIEVRRRAGPIAGIYRVPRGAELKRVKPYESLRKVRADA